MLEKHYSEELVIMDYNREKKVVKFGGSSLSCDKQFIKSAAIIKADESRRFVVPSAPGKRFADDIKITDMLIKCYELSVGNGDYTEVFGQIRDRYDSIIEGLSLNIDLDGEYSVIQKELSEGTTLDYIASRGEYLNGILLASFIGYEFIDASDVIFFDENGRYNAEKTNLIMSDRLSKTDRAVIPGFYGSRPDGSIKTFSRGGSDITGAIVARAVMADVYENWTDVSGFFMCDPKIVSNPRHIKVITYRELRELSYMGAGVLHEDSIFPVKHAGIPINIRNTNKPSDLGTMIVTSSEECDHQNIVTGIAGKKGFSIIRIEKDMMNQEKGFGMRVLRVFNDMDMSFEHLPSGIDTMCVVIAEKEIKGKEKEILTRIAKEVNPDNMDIETDIGLIAVVGRGMISKPGTAHRIFKAIAADNINVRMIDQGSSELNIIIGVYEKDFGRTIELIYNEFCC